MEEKFRLRMMIRIFQVNLCVCYFEKGQSYKAAWWKKCLIVENGEVKDRCACFCVWFLSSLSQDIEECENSEAEVSNISRASEGMYDSNSPLT